jgi:chitin synthase
MLLIFVAFIGIFYSYFFNFKETLDSDNEFEKNILFMIMFLIFGNIGSYVIIFLVNPKFWKDIASSIPSYIYYQSIYMHVLVIFSFCNIDDVTWGTKGLNENDSKNKKDEVSFSDK